MTKIEVIVTAVAPEFQVVYDQLSERKWNLDKPEFQLRDVSGAWHGRPVRLLQCGIGPVTFSRNWDQAADQIAKVHAGQKVHVTLIGVCGALREGIAGGEIFVGSHFLDGRDGRKFPHGSPRELQGAKGVSHGHYLCLDRVAETEEEKRGLGTEWSADVVDMESFCFADKCRWVGFDYQVIKVVSDDISQPLPPVNQARRTSGEYDLAAMAKIWKTWSPEKSRISRESLYSSLEILMKYCEKVLHE